MRRDRKRTENIQEVLRINNPEDSFPGRDRPIEFILLKDTYKNSCRHHGHVVLLVIILYTC